MVSKHWIDESWRLALGLITALVAGFATGQGYHFPAAFLAIYSVWMIYRFHELEVWLRDGGTKRQAPDTIGIASEIMQLIYRDRISSDKQKDRLRASLFQFNDMAAELPDATVALDDQLQIRWCNNAADPLLGLNRRRDIGQRIDNLIRYPEFCRFLENRDTAAELEIASPVNHELSLALRCVPGGDNLHILTARDITQRVKIREMRRAFVADVSHELRTPLTVIQGYLEMLQDDESLPEQTQKILNQVKDQSSRMSHIVADLLTLSRLESSVLSEHEGQTVVLADLIETIVRDMQASGDGQHTLATDVDSALQVFGNDHEIFTACQNLIHNAVRYATPGTTIDISWHRLDRGAVFAVTDQGPGVEPHHVPRLSERFYRVDTSRSRESGGTGLGLAIVKYIAQRHGGQLNIRSVTSVGSTFEITFPAERII